MTAQTPDATPHPNALDKGGSGAKPDHASPGDREADCDIEQRQEDLLDEGIEESFPASDPVSVKRIT